MDEDERRSLQRARKQRRDDFLTAREITANEAAPAFAQFAVEAIVMLAKRQDANSGGKSIATSLIQLIRRIEEDFDLDGEVFARIRDRLG
jgi:hypothetical protein